jgi:DNA-binding protein HU-beta
LGLDGSFYATVLQPAFLTCSVVRRHIMNKTELTAAVAEATELNKTQSAAAVNAVLKAIVDALSKGEEVALIGFGTFYVVDRPAGTVRSPRTGEPIEVAASKAPKFRAGEPFKKAVNGTDVAEAA